MARVVLVEGWFRGSHEAWARHVVRHSRHDVELCTLPGVHWKWRMQGGPVALSRQVTDAASRRPIDVLLVTSAVDASALVGLARRSLVDTVVVAYLHENQITFPLPDDEPRDLTYAMATWRSLLAADRILVNSDHHRAQLLDALGPFLATFPDHRSADRVDDVRALMHVVGVGVDVARFRSTGGSPAPTGPVRLLWNHRWEHDKDPDRFVAAIARLAAHTAPGAFEVVVAGSHLPDVIVRAALSPIAAHVAHVGAAADDDYPALVGSCDVVVSTARHEFYGVAVAEAVAAGCLPVVPRGLAHDELFPADLHAELLHDDDETLDHLLARAVADADRRRRLTASLAAHARSWDVSAAVQLLDDHLDEVLAGRATGSPSSGSRGVGSG